MSEWISVKDRLPETSELVLQRIDRVDEFPTFDLGLYYPEEKRWINRLSSKYTCTVTHWMPIPEPPKDDAGLVDA
jgi:hypothetical protein